MLCWRVRTPRRWPAWRASPGKHVYLFKNSVSWENLGEPNKKLSAANKAWINLIAADGNLERDDLVEMAHAGVVQYAVTPSFSAQLWKNVFTDLKIYEDRVVAQDSFNRIPSNSLYRRYCS